jgi:hypothetical protein
MAACRLGTLTALSLQMNAVAPSPRLRPKKNLCQQILHNAGGGQPRLLDEGAYPGRPDWDWTDLE